MKPHCEHLDGCVFPLPSQWEKLNRPMYDFSNNVKQQLKNNGKHVTRPYMIYCQIISTMNNCHMHLQKGGCSMLERPGVECGEVWGVVEWEG